MSKPTADQIRAYLLEQGISAPADNPKLFSEMQSLGIIESTNDGTAIWHCRIKADSGWCPPKAFSLLRIK
ncbi:TraI domain-containing protein, partial [Acinetobacter pittii]